MIHHRHHQHHHHHPRHAAGGRGKRRLSSSMEGAVTDIGYDSYATAWRYLGAYVDCGSSSSSGGSWNWWGGDGDCDGGGRKLLWAAVSPCGAIEL